MTEKEPVSVEVVDSTATSEGTEPAVADEKLEKNEDPSILECSMKIDEKQRSIDPGDEEDYHSAEDEPGDEAEQVEPSGKTEDEASSRDSSSDESDEETGSDSDSEGEEQTSEGSENEDDENDDVSDDSKRYSSGTLSESEHEPGSEEEVQPSQEEEVKERGSGDGQEAEKEKSADDADQKDPSFVPRHDRFWGHDDRATDLPEIERRPQPSRKLWERTSDKWLHDMYNEEEQAPKTREELEASRRNQMRRTGRRGRQYFDLKDFVAGSGRGRRRGRRDLEDEDRSSYRETENRERRSESFERKTNEDEETRQSRRGKKDAAFRREQQRRDSFEEAYELENRAGGRRRNREEKGERQSHRQRNRDHNEDEEYSDSRRRGFGRRETRENQRRAKEEDEYEDRNWDNRRRNQDDVSDDELMRRRRERTSQWAEDGERNTRRGRYNQDRRNEGSQSRWKRDNEMDERRGRRYRRNRQDDEHDVQQRSDNRQKAVRDGRQDEDLRTQQGGFGTDRKEGRRGKDLVQKKTEEVAADDRKPAASHSWSRVRGRGRGRAQDLQQPRKRAEDFTRERELARRTEAEKQRKAQDKKNFEDASEEDADVIVEGSDEEHEGEELHQPETGEGRHLGGNTEQLPQEGASTPLSRDRNVAAASTGQTQDKELPQSSQKGASGSTATGGAKPKRYSSQRQRVSQQIPAVSNEPVQEQLPAAIPEGYYEQMAAGYPGMYGSPGPTSTQPPMGMVPQPQGMMVQQEMTVPQDDHNEVPSGMPMHAMGQPMAPLQHEAMMQQRLAMAYQQGMLQQDRAMATANTMSQQEMQQLHNSQLAQQPVAQQERPIAPSNMMQPQSIPQMPPQQQPQAGIPQPGPVMSPVSQGNMMVAGAPHGPSSVGFVPSMQQHMLYGNPSYPMINIPGVPGQLIPPPVRTDNSRIPMMYGIPMQGGPFYPPQAMLQNQDSGDAAHLRRRPTAAIPIKPPPE